MNYNHEVIIELAIKKLMSYFKLDIERASTYAPILILRGKNKTIVDMTSNLYDETYRIYVYNEEMEE